MIWEYGIVESSARLVSEAVQSVVDDFAGGQIQEEPDFTSRMLQAIQRELNGKAVKGILWQSLVTTSHGPNAQERATGADFMGVLSINLPNYRVCKGFLAQAKRADRMGGQEMTRLQNQCENMLNLTPESYVFLYKIDGVRVLPAISVLSARVRGLTELYNRSVQRFFELHLESFIGDRRLSSASADQLDGLLEEYRVDRILYLAAKQGEMLLE
jgi:hypothetical protein